MLPQTAANEQWATRYTTQKAAHAASLDMYPQITGCHILERSGKWTSTALYCLVYSLENAPCPCAELSRSGGQ